MATYKDDLDIIKAAEKDDKNMTLNAITELDNKGLLGKYGGTSDDSPIKIITITIEGSHDLIMADDLVVLDYPEYIMIDPEYGLSYYDSLARLVVDFPNVFLIDKDHVSSSFNTLVFELDQLYLPEDIEIISGDANITFDNGIILTVYGDCSIMVKRNIYA